MAISLSGLDMPWLKDKAALALATPKKKRVKPKRSSLPAPMLITDTMPETRHMADGKHYTSKAAFRAATKAAGCVEVGNDTAPLTKPREQRYDRKQLRNDIGTAINMLNNGYKPPKNETLGDWKDMA